MGKKSKSAKEAIISAAVDCVAEDGIHSLTVRKIAQKAEVNSAAINYYFGSKHRLVTIVLERTLSEMLTMPDEIFDDPKKLPREKIAEFFIILMEGFSKYPEITIAHIYEPLIKRKFSGSFVVKFNRFLEDVTKRISHAAGCPFDDLRIPVIQMLSAVIFPSLVPRLFVPYSSVDLGKKYYWSQYVEEMVIRYFPNLK